MGKLKVLILGDGLLGSEIIKQTEWDYISRKEHGFDITDIGTYHLLTTVEFGSIQHCKYDVILNCIANTNTYSEEKDSHWGVNYKGVHNLIDFVINGMLSWFIFLLIMFILILIRKPQKTLYQFIVIIGMGTPNC